MLIHASCAARAGCGLLLTGPSGSGKSDLLFRLLDRGFDLVADDQVRVVDGTASPPARLEGLIEIRGLGLFRLPFVARARLVLAVALGRAERLPSPRRDAHGLPLVCVDAAEHSAAQRVALAFDCATGQASCVSGAFAP